MTARIVFGLRELRRGTVYGIPTSGSRPPLWVTKDGHAPGAGCCRVPPPPHQYVARTTPHFFLPLQVREEPRRH